MLQNQYKCSIICLSSVIKVPYLKEINIKSIIKGGESNEENI